MLLLLQLLLLLLLLRMLLLRMQGLLQVLVDRLPAGTHCGKAVPRKGVWGDDSLPPDQREVDGKYEPANDSGRRAEYEEALFI